MTRILIVEDETSTLKLLSTLLKAEGHEVTAVDNGNDAVKLLDTVQFDLMLSDVRMTPVNGMELLKRAHDRQPDMSVIMLTGHGTVETAVQALKLGAFDFVTKPFKVDELFLTVRKAIEAAAGNNAEAAVPTKIPYRFNNIVAASESMRKVCDMLERIAQTEVIVLLLGEDGVGKSLVAKTLHSRSKHKDGPFIHCNCEEMTESTLERALFGASDEENGAPQSGAFGKAQDGTLYIEGIHAMPDPVQERLLDVLQKKTSSPRPSEGKPVASNVRLITSSNTPVDVLVESGQMNRDLYYRLSALPVEIEPLRKRPDDIMPLVFHSLRIFLGKDKRQPSVTPEACSILQQYHWPGNVRELENVIKRALAFTKNHSLGKEALPPVLLRDLKERGKRIHRKTSEADAYRARALKAFILREKEKKSIELALKSAGGDTLKAAETLKMPPADLEKKIKQHNL